MAECPYQIDFRNWDITQLMSFMEFVKYNFPKELDKLLNIYDEWMRGN